MNFTNEEQLKIEINKRIQKAIAMTLKTMDELWLNETIKEWYADYPKPKIYERTYALLKKHTYRLLGLGYGVIELEDYTYPSRYRKGVEEFDNTLEDVMEAANEGFHGVQNFGETGRNEFKLWEEFVRRIEIDGVKELEKNLKLVGFDIQTNTRILIEDGMEF